MRDNSKLENTVPLGHFSTPGPWMSIQEVPEERLQHFWQDRIFAGGLTVLWGDPGAGKGMLSMKIAEHVSNGTPLPGEAKSHEGRVLWLGREDGDRVLKSRAVAAGVNQGRLIKPTRDSKLHDLSRRRAALSLWAAYQSHQRLKAARLLDKSFGPPRGAREGDTGLRPVSRDY